MEFYIVDNGSEKYGLWDTIEAARSWARLHPDLAGDYYISQIDLVREPYPLKVIGQVI